MRRALVICLIVAGCAAPPSSPEAASSPKRTLDPNSPYKTTFEDFMLRTKACLEDRGLTVELDPYDNSLLFSFGDQREQSLAVTAVGECQAAIDPTRLEPLPPRSDEQLRALYAYAVAQADCLIEAGYQVPSPPPEQVFIDNEGVWTLYAELAHAGIDVSQSDLRSCERIESRPAFLDW